jgi:hypothetical protein
MTGSFGGVFLLISYSSGLDSFIKAKFSSAFEIDFLSVDFVYAIS